MVNWETQVYSKMGEDLCGVQVIVKNDVGEIIDTIQVLNKTEFEELIYDLNSKLDVLDNTYVRFRDGSEIAGRTIEEILTNSTEDITINATTLQGVGKSGFSLAGHTHTKTEITNLLNEFKTESIESEITSGLFDISILTKKVFDEAKTALLDSEIIPSFNVTTQFEFSKDISGDLKTNESG